VLSDEAEKEILRADRVVPEPKRLTQGEHDDGTCSV
jgi:hypothetical protein